MEKVIIKHYTTYRQISNITAVLDAVDAIYEVVYPIYTHLDVVYNARIEIVCENCEAAFRLGFLLGATEFNG